MWLKKASSLDKTFELEINGLWPCEGGMPRFKACAPFENGNTRGSNWCEPDPSVDASGFGYC